MCEVGRMCWDSTARISPIGCRRQELDRKLFFVGFSRESVIMVEFST